ncbi:MAG TPA: DUF6489 family protein [Rhizomicrobium sp.]|nr:DUF6489 family protein [Rhizomicrobium sp.]
MKVRVEMDLTPDEARRLMGLPDLTAMQARLVEEFERRMMAAMEKSAPEEVMKQWFALGSQGVEQFQRFLWDSARNAAGSARKETPKSK